MEPWDDGPAYDWDLPHDLSMRPIARGADGIWREDGSEVWYTVGRAWLGARIRVRLEGGETAVAVIDRPSGYGLEDVERAWLWPRAFDGVSPSLLGDVVKPRLRAMALMGRPPETADRALVARVEALRARAMRGGFPHHTLESLRVTGTPPETVGTAWDICTPVIDWTRWNGTARAQSFSDPSGIATASIDELLAIMTTWVRFFRQQQDSLSPDSPHVKAVALRAMVILGELDCGLPHPSEVLATLDDTDPSGRFPPSSGRTAWCG